MKVKLKANFFLLCFSTYCFFLFISSVQAIELNPSIEFSSFLEAQKYVDQQWLLNRRLLDTLEALKLQPRLNLYSKIDAAQIESHRMDEQQLLQQKLPLGCYNFESFRLEHITS